MNRLSPSELTERIIEKAKSLGASAVGVADVEPLKESPSHRITTHRPPYIRADFSSLDEIERVVIWSLSLLSHLRDNGNREGVDYGDKHSRRRSLMAVLADRSGTQMAGTGASR